MRAIIRSGIVVCLFALCTRESRAAGFEVEDQDAQGLGTAYAARAAAVDNAAALYWNPAAMARLRGPTLLMAGIAYIPISAEFHDAGSTSLLGQPMSGPSVADGGVTEVVPHLYVTHAFSDRITAGFAVNVPFAFSTDYGESWVGRYFATKSKLRILNLMPAVSYAPNPQWSFGAALSIQYADASLANMIDFGSIGAAQSVPGLAPQANDGRVEVSGDDWSLGFSLGVHWQPREGTRIGLAWRTRVVHDIRGSADFDVPPEADPLTQGGQVFQDTGATARLNLPEKVSLSAYQEIDQKWAVVFDVSWTGWSRFGEIRIVFDNPAQPDSVSPANYRDTWRFSTGVIYRLDDRWRLRAGFAWDQSPVRDELRTPRIPDEDRFWMTVGASFRASDRVTLDFGILRLIARNADINLSSPSAGNLVGSVDVGAWSFAVSGSITF